MRAPTQGRRGAVPVRMTLGPGAGPASGAWPASGAGGAQ